MENKYTDSSLSSGRSDWWKLLSSPPEIGIRGLWTRHPDNWFTLSFAYSSSIHTLSCTRKGFEATVELDLYRSRDLCVHPDYSLIPQAKILRCHFWDNEYKAWYVIKLGQKWSKTCQTEGRADYQQMKGVGKTALLANLLWASLSFFMAVCSGLQPCLPSDPYSPCSHCCPLNHTHTPPSEPLPFPGCVLVPLSLPSLARLIHPDRTLPGRSACEKGNLHGWAPFRTPYHVLFLFTFSAQVAIISLSSYMHGKAEPLRDEVTHPSSQCQERVAVRFQLRSV